MQPNERQANLNTTSVQPLTVGAGAGAGKIESESKTVELRFAQTIDSDCLAALRADNERVRFVAPVHRWARAASSTREAEGVERGAVTRWGAVYVSAVEHLPISCAITSRALPAGPLLAEVQGQQVATMARAMSRKLAQSMRRDGREVSEATELDGAGAGALAVVQWRAGVAMEGGERGAAGVCWRAVVAEMSRDIYGETVSLADFSPEDLAGSALPLPGMYEDRSDKAARLAFERARAKRPGLLARRVETMKAKGGRGRRAEAIERVQRACVLLLHGETLDKAAELAGFNGAGKATAGDRLARAVRRLGYRVQFDARITFGLKKGLRFAPNPTLGAGLPASIPAAWAFRPAADLPGQDGRGGKRWIAMLARLNRAQRRAARLASATAARAERLERLERRADKRATTARRAARMMKGAGLLPDLAAWVLSYHEARAARIARPKL